MAYSPFESFFQDLRYGFRMLKKSPGFATIAIVTLALGIGLNTTIFSVVNGILLNPLPFHDSHQLVSLFEKIPNFDNGSISYPNFVDWRSMNRTFSGLAAYRSHGFDLSGSGEPERLEGEMISHDFFEILGVSPLLGRTFSADEDRLAANPTAMISEGLWRRKFGSAADIIGKRLILNGVGRTVIGVVPSSFHLHIQNFQRGSPPIEVYTPVGEYNEPRFYAARGNGWGLDAIGRLKPAVTLELAREDMDRVSRALAAAYPDIDSDKSANVVDLKQEMVGRVRSLLLVLLGSVACVLLIACVNVANLLLARSTTRQHEFAVRIALGAGQKRLIRQLLTESVLLGLIGGAAGLLLARFGTRAALAAVPGTLPRPEEIGLDPRVLLFTLLISIGAGIVFGLAPAWKTARTNIGAVLKESGRTVAAARSRAQSIFVIGEMALALVLLIAAGLMIRTLVRLWRLDLGFNPHNVMTLQVSGPASFKGGSADAVRAAYRQIHDKLAGTPGVESVSFNDGAHPMESDDDSYFWFVGRPRPTHQADFPMALQYVVEPGYFKLMQIQLKHGRFFTAADNEKAPAVAIIDESLAEKYYPGQDPIGQYLDLNTDPTDKEKVPNPQIVGVVDHVNQWGLDMDASFPLQAQMYQPFAQITDSSLKRGGLGTDVYLRLQRSGTVTLETLRRRVMEVNNEIVAFHMEDMQQSALETIAGKRFTMALLAIFAGLALVLASIGIYGVLSYLVGQRTQEIGVRMALGAQRSDVLRIVMGDGARMMVIGVAIGIVVALGVTRLMNSVLFGVNPIDPITFLGVPAVLCAVALLACYVPARRAMNVNPVVALRHE